MTRTLANIMWIYSGSDGTAALALHRDLQQLDAAGVIAASLWRALKAAERLPTKVKDWTLHNLVDELDTRAAAAGLRWGWQKSVASWELVIDLPTGQVRVPASERDSVGPDHHGYIDKLREADPDRICRWVAELLAQGVLA